MNSVEIPLTLDTTEFEATFSEYLKVTSRDFATAANTKAFYIARRAIFLTPAANKLAIGKSLSQAIYTFGDKGQKRLRTVSRYTRWGMSVPVPVAALLINAERGKRGKPGLYGQKMKKAVANLLSNRVRTRSYLKSGWIPSVKTLAPLADQGKAPPMGEPPRAGGKPKGYAIAAVPGTSPTALIANSIGATGPHAAKQRAALRKYGLPALQQAINGEAASMVQYMNEKAFQAARKLGIDARP